MDPPHRGCTVPGVLTSRQDVLGPFENECFNHVMACHSLAYMHDFRAKRDAVHLT